MVVQNASNPSLQSFPRAAELLASGTRDPIVLANLKSWAPGELTRSLHLLSSECGKNPIVRQYALRSLDTCNPDQVRILQYSSIVFQYSVILLLRYSVINLTHKTLCRRCLAISGRLFYIRKWQVWYIWLLGEWNFAIKGTLCFEGTLFIYRGYFIRDHTETKIDRLALDNHDEFVLISTENGEANRYALWIHDASIYDTCATDWTANILARSIQA